MPSGGGLLGHGDGGEAVPGGVPGHLLHLPCPLDVHLQDHNQHLRQVIHFTVPEGTHVCLLALLEVAFCYLKKIKIRNLQKLPKINAKNTTKPKFLPEPITPKLLELQGPFTTQNVPLKVPHTLSFLCFDLRSFLGLVLGHLVPACISLLLRPLLLSLH